MAIEPTSSQAGPGMEHDVQTALRNRVAWGAIFAGVAAALVTQLLLNMLGVGVGAAALDIDPGSDNSGSGYSIGAGIWWVVAGVIAAFAGGTTAGRLAGATRVGTAHWHGLVTWCVTTMLVAYLLTSAVGGVLGGAFDVLGSAVSGAGKAAASTASGVASVTNGDAVARQARQLVDPNGAQTVQESVADYIKASISGDRAAADAAKSRAVDGLAQSAHITPDEARARIDRAEASAREKYEVAKVKAAKAADAVRSSVATASILGFFALLLGAAASWFGAGYGASLHDNAGLRIKRTHM